MVSVGNGVIDSDSKGQENPPLFFAVFSKKDNGIEHIGFRISITSISSKTKPWNTGNGAEVRRGMRFGFNPLYIFIIFHILNDVSINREKSLLYSVQMSEKVWSSLWKIV